MICSVFVFVFIFVLVFVFIFVFVYVFELYFCFSFIAVLSGFFSPQSAQIGFENCPDKYN